MNRIVPSLVKKGVAFLMQLFFFVVPILLTHYVFYITVTFCKDDLQELVDEKVEGLAQHMERRWIPVSERLPSVKNYQRKYLVTLKDKTVCDAMFTECDGEHWWNYNYDDVIAWMPLPEPYKEESEEK